MHRYVPSEFQGFVRNSPRDRASIISKERATTSSITCFLPPNYASASGPLQHSVPSPTPIPRLDERRPPHLQTCPFPHLARVFLPVPFFFFFFHENRSLRVGEAEIFGAPVTNDLSFEIEKVAVPSPSSTRIIGCTVVDWNGPL